VSISKREVQRLLTDKQQDFLDEARDVLRAGLETSPWVSVDRFAKRADVLVLLHHKFRFSPVIGAVPQHGQPGR
jgi:hypothetical protein